MEQLSAAFLPELHRLEFTVTLLSADTVQALVGALPSGVMPQLKTVRLSETDWFLPSRRRLEINKLAQERFARLP